MSANSRQNYPTVTAGYKGHPMMGPGHYNQVGQGHGTGNYLHRGHPMSPQGGDNGMAGLTSGMAAMNVHGSYGPSIASKTSGAVLSGNASEYGSLISQGQGLWVPNMNPMYGVMANGQQQSGMTHSPGIYNHTGTFVPQAAYQYNQGMVESPMGNAWASRVSSGDLPTLMTPRRDSISSNENDIPGTPYTSAGLYRYGTSTAIMDRSPNGIYTSSATPSPSQLAQYGAQLVNPKHASVATISPQLAQLLQKDPAIPRAIPAPSSPLKPLDRSLENKTGETNVYIRGLLPETTDEMLHAWGKRFGDIQSSKSIIDLKTNLCKG